MLLLGLTVLQRAGRKNAPLRRWLEDWAEVVERAKWQSLSDVRKIYPSADGVKLTGEIVITVFNVKGNEYRLLAQIDYAKAIVEALDVLTHAEYDKDQWKKKY